AVRGNRHSLENQPAVLEPDVTAVVVVVATGTVWIHFLHQTELGHPNTLQFVPHDFLNSAYDRTRRHESLMPPRLNAAESDFCREPQVFRDAVGHTPNLKALVQCAIRHRA